MSTMRTVLASVGVLGALLFGAAFAASYVNEALVEQLARRLIRAQVERQVRERIERLDSEVLVARAGRLSRDYSEQIRTLREQLTARLPEKIAAVAAEMEDLSCECRKVIEGRVRRGLEWGIRTASNAQERLTTLIRAKYMDTAEKLTREFRIFTSTNALVFGFLALAVFIRHRAGLHLLPPAILLLGAALVTGYLYLFQQNWLHTLVFNDYIGFGYVAYLSVPFCLLCDIAFNRARVITDMLNTLFNALGSAVSVAPC